MQEIPNDKPAPANRRKLQFPFLVLLIIMLLLGGCGQNGKVEVPEDPNDQTEPAGFTLTLAGDQLELPLHGSRTLGVSIDREEGFGAAVSVSVSGLPDSITATTVTVAADASTAELTFSSDTAATAFEEASLTVTATAGELTESADLTVATVPVVTSAADSGPGSLRAIIAALPAGAAPLAVSFDAGTFGDATTITLASPLLLDSSFSLSGPLGADGELLLTLDGVGTSQLLELPESSAVITLENLVLTGGNTVGDFRVAPIHNRADLTIRNSWIHGNSGSHGGAIHNRGTLFIERSTLRGNTAGQPTEAGFAGAILNNHSSSLTLLNSTISGNTTHSSGSGALHNYGSANLISSTISHNTADGFGAGVYSEDGTNVPASQLNLKNTLIADNTASTGTPSDLHVDGNHASYHYNLIGDDTDSNFSKHPTDLTGNAGLDSFGMHGGSTPTVSTLPGSAARDQIPLDHCTDSLYATGQRLTSDQRGEPRPAPGSSRCDIGAYESN
jgi:hypothetical protein